jgi:hypothetical protein
MRTTIILLLITLACISSCTAQTDSIASKLLQYEQLYFTADTKQQKSVIAFEKWQYYLQHGIQDGCAKTQFDIEPDYLNTKQQQLFYWNAALKSLLNKDASNGLDYYKQYQNVSTDTSTAAAIVQLLLLANTSDSIVITNAQLQPMCNCIQQQLQPYTNAKKYNWFSFILPGSAMMAKGYVGKGATALLLFGGSVTAVVALLKNNLYINAVGVGLLTVHKLYVGNNVLTRKLIPRKSIAIKNGQMQNCQNQLQQLLVNNKIEYRF